MNEEILEKIINGKKHILVSGPKGSGKTANILFPIVDKLVEKKESLLVLDYKKEFVATYYDKLKEENYNIIVLDFDLAEETDGWEPFSLARYFGTKDKNSSKINRALDILCRDIPFGSPDKKERVKEDLTNSDRDTYSLEIMKNAQRIHHPVIDDIFSDENRANMLRRTTFSYDDILTKPTAIFLVNNTFDPVATILMNAFINQLLCLFNYEKVQNKMNIIAENCDVYNRHYDYLRAVYNLYADNVRIIGSVRKLNPMNFANDQRIGYEFNHIAIKSYFLKVCIDYEVTEYPYNPELTVIDTSKFKYKKIDKYQKPLKTEYFEKNPAATTESDKAFEEACAGLTEGLNRLKRENEGIEKEKEGKLKEPVMPPKPLSIDEIIANDELKNVSDEELDRMLEELDKQLKEFDKQMEEINKKSQENATKEEPKEIEMPVPEEEKPAEDNKPVVDIAPAIEVPEVTETHVEPPAATNPVAIPEMPVPPVPKETPVAPETPAETVQAPAEAPQGINVIDSSKEIEEGTKVLEQKLENNNVETNEPTIIMEKIDINKING